MDDTTLGVVLDRIGDLKEQTECNREDARREHAEQRRALAVLAGKVQKQNGAIGKTQRRVESLEVLDVTRREVAARRWRTIKYFGAGTFSVLTVAVGVFVQHVLSTT
jgi:hypothetical protein